jgi:GT2 family glycosyltransferase
MAAAVDVVVVSFNSRDRLRECVEPFAGREDVAVFVVDNASTDGSLESLADLPVTKMALDRNGGFAHGCNTGWQAGEAPTVLFLNPDARLRDGALDRLLGALDENADVAAVAPKIVDFDGALDFSQRRFPRLRSTYAQALFLHRLFPRARWTDEVVRDEDAYDRPGSPDWVSGACILVRRSALERLDGLDEGFFMYCEDIDLCRRLWDSGSKVAFEPGAVAEHEGGASAPRPTLLPVLAASRVRYAAKHRSQVFAALERLGIALGALTHIVVSRGGREMRRGHARALWEAASRS